MWYHCEACEEAFESDREDAEALEEAQILFPNATDLVSVCEDCFHRLTRSIPLSN